MSIPAIFARVVSLPQVPLDPVHRATATAAAVIPPALWLGPRCSRSLSFAPLPPVENVQNTVSLPLAVSFPAKCVFFYCLIFGVHSTLEVGLFQYASEFFRAGVASGKLLNSESIRSEKRLKRSDGR